MIRNFSVTPVLNGFIVNIGCQTVVFESKETLTLAFISYVNNPADFEKDFVQKACNREQFPDAGPVVEYRRNPEESNQATRTIAGVGDYVFGAAQPVSTSVGNSCGTAYDPRR